MRCHGWRFLRTVPSWRASALAIGGLAPLLAIAAHAQTVQAYKCVDRRGQLSFQDLPCPRDSHATRLSLPTPRTPAPSPAASSARHVDNAPPPVIAPPAKVAPPPLPSMYACTRATDRKRYLSDRPTPPYYAPLAMLDDIPRRATGTLGAAPTVATVAGAYTQVQDACHALTPAKTCAALEDAYAANAAKLSRAFRSDQPPLARRDASLREQLRACPGH